MSVPLTQQERRKRKRAWQQIAKAAVVFNLASIVVLTTVQMLLGHAFIATFIDPGSAQMGGDIGWFALSLLSAFCVTVALDFFLVVLGGMAITIFEFIPQMGKARRSTPPPPSPTAD